VSALTRRLGKYHVLDRIAQGGMAEIYKAKTVGIAGFEKILALKRILPTFAREARFIRSFIDEARIAVTLNHRNIVQVFDFGKADGELYLAMELIEGVDLKSALESAREANLGMPPAVACCILADVAAGLDYAHRKADAEGRPLGIVHCDVSPQNVMLSYEGFIKILDFGVARARFANPPREKRLRGKPRYMAPEQTRGLIPTAATDVFALGILCWELLTGLPLFEGSDLGEILAAVRRADAPRVSSLNPDVPEYLSEAIARALAPQQDRRGDAGELAIALARTARELTPLPSSRAIAEWLSDVLGTQEPYEQTTSEFSSPDPGDRHEAITSTTSTGNTTIITEIGDEVPMPPDLPPAHFELDIVSSGDESVDRQDDGAALVENRRVVATAVVADGGESQTRRELCRMVAELAYKHGALVHGHTGDGLVAVFGLEVAGEDDIASAMQFSLDAVELARETTQADRTGGPSLRVATRAGIAAQRSARTLHLRGDAIEEARALAREAEPSRPLLTGGTGRLASAQFAFRELPARRLRSRRLRILELLGPRDFDERTRALHQRRGRFVGRLRELERMDAALQQTLVDERRRVIAVVGEAGVGKSRLVAEFVARVQSRPHPPRLIAVAASPVARDAPFWLVGDLLQSALNMPPRRGQAARGALIQRLRHVLTPVGMDRAEVDESLASVELALELRDGGLGAATEAHASANLRERVTSALRGVRRALAGPLLMVVEDLHLADVTSGEVLRSALRSPEGGDPDMVVLTSRGDLEGLPPGTEIIQLADLEEPERSELVTDRLAEASTAVTVAAVARRARGNPLFIEELASAVREGGRAEDTDGGPRAGEVPAGVRDVLIARVDRLPPETRATLQHAAVVGPVFRSRILEELLGSSVHHHLQELVEEGMIVRADYGAAEVDEGELAFQHDLLQEVVYESLAGAARRRTHARLGKLLAARLDAGREEPPLLVARHLELGGEPTRAAAVWLRAGQIALAAHDAAEARDAFSRVLELEGKGPDSRATRREALLGREQANRELGDHAAQAGDLSQLEEFAVGDVKLEADLANRRATRLLRIGDYAGAVAAAEAAEAAARSAGDELSRGEALRVLGEAYERTGEFERGLSIVSEAVEVFRSIGAAHDEMKARIGIGRNHLTRSRYEAAWETYEPILERLDETADPWLERVVRNHVAVIHLCLGEFEAAMWSARRSMELCEFYGDRARAGDNLSVCGIILTEVGQYHEARERFRDALAIHDQTQSRWSRADCQVYAGGTEACLGEFAAGAALLTESIATAREIGARYVEANGEVALAALLLRRGDEGDEEAAVAACDRGLETARASTLVGPEIVALARRAEALRRLGRTDEALASSTRAVELLAEQKYLEGPEEEILFVQYRVLAATGEPSATGFLARAREGVQRKLEMLTNPDWRRSYVEEIALHHAILDGA
jgi:serine/threonine protein kinase/tetratricopeptide (TPR) repeat protein